MEQPTKLDLLKKANEVAEIRKKNIAELKNDLKEAKEIYGVLPSGNYEAETNRRELNAHIRLIESLIADEERALNLLSGVDGKDVETAVNILLKGDLLK